MNKWISIGVIIASFILQSCKDGNSEEEVQAAANDEVTLSTPDEFLKYFNQYEDGELDSVDYAEAYYKAVDPSDLRDTFSKFINNIFNMDVSSDPIHVIFRDTKDLGYGRDMHARIIRECEDAADEFAIYVRNFIVEPVPGFDYGPLNLDAAIADDTQYHFGTNVIEYSRPDGSGCDESHPFVKFYNYSPTGQRNLVADLDGRGDKAMPQICISCHGGRVKPITSDGSFTQVNANDPAEEVGDTKSQFQPLDIDTFEFSDQPGYTKGEQLPLLKEINLLILSSFPESTCLDDSLPSWPRDCGEWQGDFARELVVGRYGGEGLPDDYDGGFVPAGWNPDPMTDTSPPVGADQLFIKVVGPHCVVCHSLQGSKLGTNGDTTSGKDIDFSTWQKFISYADEIARLVYDEGRMPMSLLNYEGFWSDPDKADLLASFLSPYVDDFVSRYTNPDGSIKQPGRPLAEAGEDRLIPPNTPVILNGSGSLFADKYTWSVIDTPDNASFTFTGEDNQSLTPDFSAVTPGTYLLELTASSSLGGSDTDSVTIEVADGAPNPYDLMFDHIKNILELNCIGCHASNLDPDDPDGLISGIPVWYTEDQPSTTASQLTLYEQVLSSVNFNDIHRSPIMTKLTEQHHYSGLIVGFDTSEPVGNTARANYDLLVNWIYAGAPEQ